MTNKIDDIEIPVMKVEYPSEAMMNMQKDKILYAVMPKKVSFLERMKRIYVGPGLKVVFYQCKSAWFVMGLVYLSLLYMLSKVGDDERMSNVIALMTCPLLYLVFSFVSYLAEEQAEVIDLNKTLYYSFNYIISLRMFYTSIATILMSLTMLSFMDGYSDYEIWQIGAVGISSMFLFAGGAIYLSSKVSRSYSQGIMILLWLIICAIVTKMNHAVYNMVFEIMPLSLHIGVALLCFVYFIIYIRKVGERYAYTYKCN